MFAAVAEVLIRRASQLYRDEKSDPDFPRVVFALDASIIHLSLKLFPWAYWGRSRASAVKLHTLISLKGNLPIWAAITEAAFPEVKMLDQIPVEPGAFSVMDRGHLDFTRLIRCTKRAPALSCATSVKQAFTSLNPEGSTSRKA